MQRTLRLFEQREAVAWTSEGLTTAKPLLNLTRGGQEGLMAADGGDGKFAASSTLKAAALLDLMKVWRFLSAPHFPAFCVQLQVGFGVIINC